MKLHNIIFKIFLAIALIGLCEVIVENINIMKDDEKIKYKNFNFLQITENFENDNILTKLDKKVGDDDAKNFLEKNLIKKTNLLNIQPESFNIEYAEISKSQLFLLYSSLKLDC